MYTKTGKIKIKVDQIQENKISGDTVFNILFFYFYFYHNINIMFSMNIYIYIHIIIYNYYNLIDRDDTSN